MGQGTAVDAKKGGQIFSGEGDGKGGFLKSDGLHGQICDDSIPQSFLGKNCQTVFFFYILVGNPYNQPT